MLAIIYILAIILLCIAMLLIYFLIPVILTNKILKLELSKKWIFRFFIYTWFFPITALFSKPYYKELIKKDKIKNKLGFIKIIGLILLISVSIKFINSNLLKENYYKPFQISGNAMLPTMYDKEFLLIKKENEYKRKDIIVFKNPNNKKLYFIKRIIGLPNETLKISSGSIFIKGENETDFKKLEENYVLKENNLKKIKEFDGMVYKIPENSYFLLGDNRDNSIASLECFKKACEQGMTKYVKTDLIIGKPYFDLGYLNFKSLDFINYELGINTYPKFFNINK